MQTFGRNVSIFGLFLITSSWLPAQQAATPQSILAGVVAGLGEAKIQGLSLSGNAESIAGETDDTGSFTASCAVNGSSQLQLQLSSSSRTEIRQMSNGTPTGTWTDSQGNQHAMVGHNLLTTESWFCPGIALSRFLQNSNLSIQFVGQESKNGTSVDHFTVSAIVPDSSLQSALFAHLTNIDIYLDAATLRPVEFDFGIHPDNDANVDIQVEVLFSNYTNVGGVWIPFTVEKYLNSGLALKLQLESASPSTAGSAVQ